MRRLFARFGTNALYQMLLLITFELAIRDGSASDSGTSGSSDEDGDGGGDAEHPCSPSPPPSPDNRASLDQGREDSISDSPPASCPGSPDPAVEIARPGWLVDLMRLRRDVIRRQQGQSRSSNDERPNKRLKRN